MIAFYRGAGHLPEMNGKKRSAMTIWLQHALNVMRKPSLRLASRVLFPRILFIHVDQSVMCPSSIRRLTQVILPVLLVLELAGGASAQDLEPRAFSPAPVGLNILSIGYGYSSGNVFFDQALPIEDATGRLHIVTAGYLRTMSLFGLSAKLGAVLPFGGGDWEGLVTGEHASTSRLGFGDPAVILAMSFVGAPALKPEQFRTYREGLVAGASAMAVVPLGQYNPDKLINLGSNRWAFRTRLGVSHRVGRWVLETIGEVWFFTRNQEAYGDVWISQDPLVAGQFNVIYQTPGGLWVGGGYGYGEGGRTTVSGQEKNTRQVNKRFGGTLVIPINLRNGLKLVYFNSLSSLIGAEFDRVELSWRVLLGR